MHYRCTFVRAGVRKPNEAMITADGPLQAAITAARKALDTDFDKIEVFLGATRLITWEKQAPEVSHRTQFSSLDHSRQ